MGNHAAFFVEAGSGMWHSAAVEVAMTKEYTNLILEAMNDKFQQMLECFSVHSKEIADLRSELKEDIAVVDAKVMGLSRRVDHVEERLSREIAEVRAEVAEVRAEVAEVRADLADHRANTEMHAPPRKRALKKVI